MEVEKRTKRISLQLCTSENNKNHTKDEQQRQQQRQQQKWPDTMHTVIMLRGNTCIERERYRAYFSEFQALLQLLLNADTENCSVSRY